MLFCYHRARTLATATTGWKYISPFVRHFNKQIIRLQIGYLLNAIPFLDMTSSTN